MVPSCFERATKTDRKVWRMAKRKPTAKWMRLSEKANALDYLEKAYQSIRRVQANEIEWKWVVIGLHGALYGFAICALERGNWENVTKETKKGHRLITFEEAINRCQRRDDMVQFVHSQPLHLSKEQKESIKWLHRAVRNNIEHYIPKLWSVEKHDLTVTTIAALDVIRALALDTGNVHLDKTQREKVLSWTRKAKKVLMGSQLYKDSLAAKKLQQK
jgi:hypothetical protein